MPRAVAHRPDRRLLLRGALGLAFLSVRVLGLRAVAIAGYSRGTAETVIEDQTALAGDRLVEIVSVGLAQRIAPLLSQARPNPNRPDPIAPTVIARSHSSEGLLAGAV